MSLTFGFYNSINGDRVYDAIQMGQIFDGIITDGIYATYLKAMVVKASDNASEVIVQPGRAWFNHTWTYIDADYPVEAPAPEVILDRVDTLVLDINAEYSNRENKIIWVTGTPASVNPEAPALINTTTHHQYPLCNVYRKAGTTMIYAADITNRVGTSATPFVTGVLTGINIDDLLSQWDDEFHTWENATKTSFEGWMVNQQSVYTTWFNSIRSQMAGDLDEFEAWFETIKGIIDEEAATHLQAEIDELKDMLPAGSHIDITTTEPTLYSRNVTVSDGVHSKTVQFNASGSATVESFPYIGSIEVTSTDGERTATSNISIPYFGRYNTTLAFWAARVNLKGGTELGGYTVTVKDHLDVTVTSIILNAEGNGTFTATYPDTYKFVYTYGGQTMETTLQVTQETTYEVEIHGGFNYQAWLTAGRVSKTFASLDEILADEKTLRQLMLVHDSVDYLANANVNSDVEKIFNTDLAAKWINNSDYALDKFYAVADIKTVMDAADKYGYGEWCLMPQVPKMTSATAPIGEVIYSTQYSGEEAYKAFDGDSNTNWSASTQSTNEEKLGYRFASGAVAIKGVRIKFSTNSGVKATLVYSDDGTNWTNTDAEYTSVTGTDDVLIKSSDYSKHAYWALKLTSSSNSYKTLKTVQFYAYAPKGNVPVMTANNAPYGEAFASSTFDGNNPAWAAFDDDDSHQWTSAGGVTNGTLGYKFTTPVCVKMVKIQNSSNQYCDNSPHNFTIEASNDNSTWDVLFTGVYTKVRKMEHENYKIDSDNYYLYYRINATDKNGSSLQSVAIGSLQFYGRELKVSVPTMTSNTAPFGEVFANGQDDSNYVPWHAFDGVYQNASSQYDRWSCPGAPSTSNPFYIGYSCAASACIKKVVISNNSWNDTAKGRNVKDFKLQGSNDGTTWVDIGTTQQNANTGVNTFTFASNTTSYKKHRLLITSNHGRSDNTHIGELQFYGLDYSEKEFEVGTTKKWLYDHGVELETLAPPTSFYGNNNGSIDKQDSAIKIVSCSPQFSGWGIGAAIDLSDYNVMRMKAGNAKLPSSGESVGIRIFSSSVASGTSLVANYAVASGNSDIPNNIGLDISSINQTEYAYASIGNNSDTSNPDWFELTEFWLE